MAGPARRDLVWDAAMRALLSNPASIRLRDVQDLIENEGVSERTVRRTMNAMETLGWLEKEKERGHYWYPGPKAVRLLKVAERDVSHYDERPSDPPTEQPSDETANQPQSGEPSDPPGGSTRDHAADVVDDGLDDPVTDEIRDRIDEIHVPGSGEVLRRRRKTLQSVLEHLRENGQASPSELKTQFYEEGADGYKSAHSWWKNFVYRSLKDSDLAESGGEGSHTWFYVYEE